MSRFTNSTRIIACLTIAMVMLTASALSATYTAVTSGNWSAVTTWGGPPPGTNNTNNLIVIPAGITVTMEGDVTINGGTAGLTVLGTLTSAGAGTLTLTQGALTGTGTMTIGTLSIAAGALLAFTGNVNAEYITSASTGIQAKAQMTVTKGVTLTGGVFTIATNGQLTMAANSMITMAGGTIALNGGLLTLTNAYNVRYTTGSATTGIELGGTGLNIVTLDVPAASNVTLGSSLTIAPTGTLALNSGTLKLNGKDLTVHGALTAAVGSAINSTSASDIAINSVAGTVGVLDFAGAGNQVDQLSIGVGVGANASISGTLEVMGGLGLANGSLQFNGASLTVNGPITGAGMLSGDANSNLTINTSGGVSTGIRFAAAGQNLKNFTINVGVNSIVRLLTPLKVNGNLALTGGSNLNISDIALTLNGDISGTGALIITGNSGLTVNTPNGLTSAVAFSGNTIGNLTVNTDSGKTVTLASDLIVWQMLTMQRGTLVLNGNDLTVNGDIAATGTGFIQSTNASDINIVSLTGGTAGKLRFAGTTNAAKSLTVSVLATSTTGISGTLTVDNSLNLQLGTLIVGGSTLIMNGNVTGGGALATDANTNLVFNTPGGVPAGLNLKDAAGGALRELRSITVNVGASNAVKILSDLTVLGATTLTSGNLDISNFDLSLGGQVAGSGAFTVNSNSGIMVNTLGGLTSPINLSGASIGDFGINVGTGGTVKLGTDMSVAKTLTLNGGTLILNDNNLVVGGNVVGGVTAMVQSTAASDVSIVSSTSTTGVIRFADNSEVGTLKIDVGSANSARIGGNVDVMNTLDLTSGSLVFHDADLTLNGVLIGNGTLNANNMSNLTVNTAGGLSTGLRFAGNGKTLNNLTVNVGAASSVELGADVVVSGTLDLGSGTLGIGDYDLTLGGPVTGTGSIGVTNKSTLIVNTPGGPAGPLSLVGTSLGFFTVNPGAGGSVSLANDLEVSSRLNTKSGTLVLNGNDLTLSGIVDGTGSGTVSSTNSSNITFATLLSSTGKFMLDSTANTVNNLTVATVGGGSASVGTDMNVEGVLTLTSGTLDISNNTLTIASSGSVVGGSPMAYVETSMGGALAMNLSAGASAATTFPVGTATGYFPADVKLNAGSGSGVVNVGTYEGVYSMATQGQLISLTESTVNATWAVTSDVSNVNMNLDLAWEADAEVNNFNRNDAYISGFVGSAWDANTRGAATVRGDGMVTLSRANITAMSPFAVFDGSTTSVEDDVLAANTTVYPSPASDVLVVENGTFDGAPMTIDIVDATGRLVMSTVMDSQRSTISLSRLNAGMYLMRLHNHTTSATKSFIKM